MTKLSGWLRYCRDCVQQSVVMSLLDVFASAALAVLSSYSLRVSACDHITGRTFEFPLCLAHDAVLVDGRYVPYAWYTGFANTTGRAV